jgi:M6 family metalloprotease-like protein
LSASVFRKNAGRLVFLVLFLFAASSAEAVEGRIPLLKRSGDGRFVPSGVKLDREPHPRSRLFPFDGVSTRNLLHKPPVPVRTLAAAAGEVDTVRVLLIRIAFLSDRVDALSSITTGGDFDLTPGGEAIIDPTPHDKNYFDSHLLAMRNYYHFQSCGRLEITWDILPEGLEESYKLSDIADYGPGTTELWTVERLVALFRDGVVAADQGLASQGYPVRIGDYDAIILAHAGSNLQSDVDYDTPNDIPSFFARLGDDDRFTVDGGQTIIEDGSVIPESASQDGFLGGIAAVLFHEFGHQLGLPDLYNIYTNNPTVGVWDIMDSGGLVGAYIEDDEGGLHYAEGFLPTGLSAWSKAFLGWADVHTVQTFENVIGLSATEKCPARLVRIEASSDEYFLVENRAAELDDLPTLPIVAENGVIIGMGNCLNCAGGFPETPIWELTNGYDLLLPTESDIIANDGGPGLLVWHVDESLIEERWEENVVNSLYPFGITLLEASGVVDLGDPYSYFWMGWYDDAFYSGNNSTLSDSTMPASWSNWHVPTGVRLENVSSRDTMMTFGAGIRAMLGTSPNPAGGNVAPFGYLPSDGDGFEAILVDRQGRVWVTGEDLHVAELGAAPMTPPARSEGFDGTWDALIVADAAGRVHALRIGDWTEPAGWPHLCDTTLASHPVAANTDIGKVILFSDMNGRINLVSRDGSPVHGSPPPPLPDGERYVGNLVLVTDAEGMAGGLFALSGGMSGQALLHGWDFVIGIGDSLHLTDMEGFPLSVPIDAMDLAGDMTLLGGEIDPGEPGLEVCILAMDTGHILLGGGGGILFDRNSERGVTTLPALLDLDGDSRLDILYGDEHSIYALAPSGTNLSGWPRNLNEIVPLTWGAMPGGAITGLVSSQGGLVLAGSRYGLLYAFDPRGDCRDGYPRKMSSDFKGSVDILSTRRVAYLDGGNVRWRSLPLARDNDGTNWVTAFGDYARSSFAGASDGWIETEGEWLALPQNLVVYPNPSRGERVGFHFTAPEEGHARVEIMTLTGELVLSEQKSVSGGQDEIVVSMNGKASGIYLCRLVVTSRGQSVEAYRKLAIVK